MTNQKIAVQKLILNMHTNERGIKRRAAKGFNALKTISDYKNKIRPMIKSLSSAVK